MKPNDFQRDITPRAKRPLGASHELGRLTRVRDRDLDHGRKNRGSGKMGRRENAKQSRSSDSPVSIVVLSIVGTAVLAIFLTIWTMRRVGSGAAGAAKTRSEQNAPTRVASRFPPPNESEAIAIVNSALSQRDPALIAKQVRLGAASAEEAGQFFAELKTRDGTISHYNWLSSMDQGNTLIEGVSVAFEKDHLKGQRLALLTPDDQGVWKLDFESFARRVSPSWVEILGGEVPKATVRVVVGKDSYYNGPFTEGEWRCFGLASPDLNEVVHSYCRVGSEQELALEKLFEDGVRLSRALLEIRRVPDAGSHQFEVSKVIVADWLLPGDS